MLRVQSAPASEVAWATGATGEEMLADRLARTCPEAIVLHDRRLPGRRTNLDHIAVAPSGVYVIDAKRYRGKIEVRKPLRGEQRLLIAGRDKTKLVEGLLRQRQAVQAALAETVPAVPVHACLCFLNPSAQAGGTDLPLLRTLSINDIPLLIPRRLSKRLNAQGPLSPESRRDIAGKLAHVFPAA
jgi:hypothetical protein